MLFIEILLSIHCLLLVSSWFIGSGWLLNQPTFKLKLLRLLLVSCVISPLLVHCITPTQKQERLNSISLDALQKYVNQPILKTRPLGPTSQAESSQTMITPSYGQLILLIFCALLLFRAYRLVSGLNNLRLMLAEAIPYRKAGKLVIKVSHRCDIPFSVYLFNKSYIILPVSLFSSLKNVTIAIAHEGQHHRNRDCLWAYFMELVRILFFGNPGVTRWASVLNELQEFSCDEVLVGQPKISAHDYGHCLFQVVQTVSQGSLSLNQEFACAVGMALSNENSDRTFLIRRISMLTTYPLNASKSLFLGIAFTGVSIIAPICIAYSAAGTLTGAKTKEINTAHLDPKIQNIADQEIAKAVKKYQAKSGVIAIADPKTGAIIAFAEAGANSEHGKSWKSRVFSPGSTIKPFIAAAAIDSGTSSETKTYDCHSPYYVGGRAFTNSNVNVGSATLTEAMAKSVNVCLIKVSQEAGASVIRQKLGMFGFDMSSWGQGNQSDDVQLASASLGESVPVTIEALTQSYTILANKGHLLAPKNGSAISEKTTSSVTHMLENAVLNGTGKRAIIPGVAVAGKTGTVVENIGSDTNTQLALFAGYAPADAPRYVMVVVIEDGYLNENSRKLTSGGELAAPVFHNVVTKSLDVTN